MAKRIDLRAYRDDLAARLAAATAEGGAPTLLGFEAGDGCWLVDLPAAGEVLPVPALEPVPLTRPWFAGLASVHGELRAVVDFAVFCGGAPTPRDGAARLLCVGAPCGSDAALLVARVHGLLRAETLLPAAAPAESPWGGEAYEDAAGRRWTRLDLGRLLAAPEFLDAALPAPSPS